jgi:hypothetical protein
LSLRGSRPCTAYEKACASLGLSPVPDRINEILITKIVDLAKTEQDSFTGSLSSMYVWNPKVIGSLGRHPLTG